MPFKVRQASNRVERYWLLTNKTDYCVRSQQVKTLSVDQLLHHLPVLPKHVEQRLVLQNSVILLPCQIDTSWDIISLALVSLPWFSDFLLRRAVGRMQVTSTGCSIEHDNISVIMLSCRLRPLSLFSPEVKLIPRKQRPTLSDAGNSPLLEVGSSAPSVSPPPVLLDLLEAGAGVYRGSKTQDRDKYRPL